MICVVYNRGADNAARTRGLCRDSKQEGPKLLKSGERVAPLSAPRSVGSAWVFQIFQQELWTT